MGAWVTLETAAADPGILGALSISAGDMGAIGESAKTSRASAVAEMKDNMEALAGVTPESMADELAAHGAEWSFKTLAPRLVKAAGATKVESAYVPTDHGWSDRRVLLQALVINWLESLARS
jgi:dienelactone hydrolase